MQHEFLTRICMRAAAGVMFAGALLIAAPSAFADDANAFSPNASSSQDDAVALYPAARAQQQAQSSQSQYQPVQAAAQYQQTQYAPARASASTDDAGLGSRAKSFLSGMADKASNVVVGALNMIGVRYTWGGNTPDSGLDCSGFVRYVFKDTLGLVLPRSAEGMSQVGQRISMSDLKPGDLVFFDTMRRTFSHVGIYIGGNKFVHSPSTGNTIRVDNLNNSYWEKRFTGGRRIETSYAQQQDFRQRVSTTFGGFNHGNN